MDITRSSIVLEDGQWAQVTRGDKMFSVRNMALEEQTITLETIIGDISLVEKAGFDHHMIKEITRQPESLSNCLRGRVAADGHIHLGGLSAAIDHNGQRVVPLEALRAARQVPAARRPSAALFTPSCRSRYARAARAGTRRWWASETRCNSHALPLLVLMSRGNRYLIETLANTRVEVEYAREFRYRQRIPPPPAAGSAVASSRAGRRR